MFPAGSGGGVGFWIFEERRKPKIGFTVRRLCSFAVMQGWPSKVFREN